MAKRRAGLVILGTVLALTVLPTEPAHACSCGEADPSLAIHLEIEGSKVETVDNPWAGGDDLEWTHVDLRGEAVRVVGQTPTTLQGQAIEEIPVVAQVYEDPRMGDSCDTPQRPAAGSDLDLRGTVYDEGDGPFIYAGPCSGGFDVVSAPVDPAPPPDGGGGSNLAPIALGTAAVGMAGLVVVLAVRSRRADPT